jgi:prophage antirepressor-like protein
LSNIITSVFEGSQIHTIHYHGDPVWIAKECGSILEYGREGKSLVELITGKWKEDFIEGEFYIKLTGNELAEFKMLLEADSLKLSARTSHLILLKEPGLWQILLNTRKPVGVRLRQFVAKEILPALRKAGSYTLPGLSAYKEDLERRMGEYNFLCLRRSAVFEFLHRCVECKVYGETALVAYSDDTINVLSGGKEPEGPRYIDVSSFLEGKDLPESIIRSRRGNFGKALKVLYIEKHGKDPEKGPRMIDGAQRSVALYQESERPLFELVYAEFFGIGGRYEEEVLEQLEIQAAKNNGHSLKVVH